MTQALEKKAPPVAYLLKASDADVGNFELAKLSEVANLRSAMLEMFDRLVDLSAQAVLAAMLRGIDRQELVRQLLESSTVTIEGILADAKAQIRSQGRSPEELEAGSSVRIYPPGVASRNASKRYQAANLAEGKCRVCPEPLCRESVEYCTRHLAMQRKRERKRREKQGALVGMHGRHPNTLKALKEANEKRVKHSASLAREAD